MATNINAGEIPCFKLFESDKTLAFLDIGPLSKGHAVSSHIYKYINIQGTS
jgi:diadenosine tetraphosphate (Ap4A) HIT family hydrolase